MLITYFVNFRQLNDHLFGKELFIRFTASAFRKLPSIYVFSYFPFGFEDRMCDLIVSVPDHCLSFYFPCIPTLFFFLGRDSCHTSSKALQASRVTSSKALQYLLLHSVLLTRSSQHLSGVSRESPFRYLGQRYINITRNAIGPKSGQKDCRKF